MKKIYPHSVNTFRFLTEHKNENVRILSPVFFRVGRNGNQVDNFDQDGLLTTIEADTGEMGDCILHHDHGTVIGKYHQAGEREVKAAIEAALEARRKWAKMDWQDRAAVFLKAADLLSGPWRSLLNAAAMLGQSKNVFQAEIDAACELIDFFRFNAYYAMQILELQPPYSPYGMWNRMVWKQQSGNLPVRAPASTSLVWPSILVLSQMIMLLHLLVNGFLKMPGDMVFLFHIRMVMRI